MGLIRGVGLRKEGRGKHPTEIMRGGEGVVNPYSERGFQRWQKMPKRGKGCVRNDRLKMVVICSDPPPLSNQQHSASTCFDGPRYLGWVYEERPEKIGRVGENELPSRIYCLLSSSRRNTPKRDISQLFCCFLRLCYLKGSFCASSIAWLSGFFVT